MTVIAWIVLGLLAGFIASRIVNRSADGLVLNGILGVLGALLGGLFFQRFAMAGLSALNFYGILVAVAGAIVVLFLFHAFIGRSVASRPRRTWH